MKIVHYQPQLQGPESGTANAGRGWCEALARLNVDVHGLVDGRDVSRPPPEGAQTVALRHLLRGNRRIPRGVLTQIENADVVVLHGGWTLTNILVGHTCDRANVPFVVTTHGVYTDQVLERRPLEKRTWAALLERRHLQRAAAVHVFFPEEQGSLTQRMKVHTPTIVAPNGISCPEGVAWDGGSGGYLLWLGRFDPETKGLDLLVRAIARIPADERLQVRLHGPDWRGQKQRVRGLVTQLGMDRWVKIGEPVYADAKWDLLRAAVGCLYPSRRDACPVAVMEAAAVGVPTLVTRYPLANFLASKGAAVQVDPDALSVSEGIRQLTSPEGRQTGGSAALVARRDLSWDAVAASWLSQLRPLLPDAGEIRASGP